MTAPPPIVTTPLFDGQIVYIRCRVELPASKRYDDPTTCVVQPCDAAGRPDADTWFYVQEKRCIPRTKLREELE